MVKTLVDMSTMTIMTDPGAGVGAGVCDYGPIMATMMGNLSHDWPTSTQPTPNVPRRRLL